MFVLVFIFIFIFVLFYEIKLQELPPHKKFHLNPIKFNLSRVLHVK